jgi:outer membrane protein W
MPAILSNLIIAQLKKYLIMLSFFFPAISNGQAILKAGALFGNRWNESLNNQTTGKGFELSAEHFVAKNFTIGVAISYVSFQPTNLVKVRFNSYDLLFSYYLNNKKLRPYIGVGAGICKYLDEVTIQVEGGASYTQQRKKNYGDLSPFLGLLYHMGKQQNLGVFLQVNADFVPIATIQPIGYLAASAGIHYSWPSKSVHNK